MERVPLERLSTTLPPLPLAEAFASIDAGVPLLTTREGAVIDTEPALPLTSVPAEIVEPKTKVSAPDDEVTLPVVAVTLERRSAPGKFIDTLEPLDVTLPPRDPAPETITAPGELS